MTVSDGTKYVGTWKDDAYLLGTMTQANGGIYEGPFVDGVYAELALLPSALERNMLGNS